MASFLNHPTARTLFKRSYSVAVGLAGIVFVRDHVVEVMGIQGPSMAPTLSPAYHESGRKDYVFFSRWAPAAGLKRGDIVSFWAPHAPEKTSVKRVVALQGDTVITKARGTREPYRFRRLVVPHNHVWVEGDNWRMSKDSNDFGPLTMPLINGRAVCVVSPWSRYSAIADSKDFKPRSNVIPAKTGSNMPAEYVD